MAADFAAQSGALQDKVAVFFELPALPGAGYIGNVL
jgi:hypothetical protein